MTARHASPAAAAWRLAPACAAACALLAAPAARADDEPNPYTLGVLETLSHDSNVFRAPAGPQVFADWLSTTGLVASIDQQISRQHLHGSGEFDLDRFKNQKQLNSTAHSASLEDDWTTIDRLSGEFGYSDSSQLYRYNLSSTVTETGKNTLHTGFGFARLHLGVVTRLTFDVGAEFYKQDYSAADFRYRDLNRRDGSFGLTWQSSADLRSSLSFKRTTGKYPHYLTEQDPSTGDLVELPDDFTRDDVILGIAYNASGASQFRLNVSRAREQHSLIISRSFNTWATDGNWTWTPTGRTQLSLDFIRDNDTGSENVDGNVVVPDSGSSATDATQRTALTGKLAYQLTGKISLTASGSYTHRDLDTAFAPNAQFGIAGADIRGTDKLYQASLGLNYAATRALQFGCNFAREKRSVQGQSSVTLVTYPYNDTLYSCTGQFSFN